MSDTTSAGQPLDSDQLHELRNRLTVVKGVAQLLDRQVRQDDWQREKIVSRVDRLQSEISILQHLIEAIDAEDPDATSKRIDDQLH